MRALGPRPPPTDSPLPGVGGRRTRSDTTPIPDAGNALPNSKALCCAGRIADALSPAEGTRSSARTCTIISGGAPLASTWRTSIVAWASGYGLSETNGPISVETPQDFLRISVGFFPVRKSDDDRPDGEPGAASPCRRDTITRLEATG